MSFDNKGNTITFEKAFVHICDKYIIKNKPKAPWYKSKEQKAQEWDILMEDLKKRLEQTEK